MVEQDRHERLLTLRSESSNRLPSAPLLRSRVLVRYRRKPIVLLALLALLVAQAGAGLHALRHFGLQGDPAGLPGHHAQLCLECASFAPLASVHGGTVTAFAVAALFGSAFLRVFAVAASVRQPRLAFRSRAPPR